MQAGIDAARPAAPWLLVYDIGSSSVRTVLFDAQARMVPGTRAQSEQVLQTTADGGAELDPGELLQRLAGCVDDTLARAGASPAPIAAVTGATLVSTLLGVGGDGAPRTPVYTYADTRCEPDARLLRDELDESAVHQRTGCMLRTSYWPALMRWLARTRPEAAREVRRWIGLGEYLLQELCGVEARTSHSVASWTGLLDRRSLEWDAPLLEHLALRPEQLPLLSDFGTPAARELAPAWAKRWPALRGAAWFPSLGDGAAANVGSGCIGPDRIALTIGTSGAMRVMVPAADRRTRDVPRGLWEYRVDRHRALLGGALNEGGRLLHWMRSSLQLPEPEMLEAELAAMRPDAHGLTMLPFLAGERAPGWAAEARGSVIGLHVGTTPSEIVRAGIEAVAYRFGFIHQLLQPQLGAPAPGAPRRAVVASGGALLRSPAWMQIVADVLETPVTASAEPEETARGAALLALEALGALPDVAAAPAALGRTYEPNADRHVEHAAAMLRQLDLYRRLIG